ncbi:unnamed protein product [Ectocarpus sp. 13 AM-2016]
MINDKRMAGHPCMGCHGQKRRSPVLLYIETETLSASIKITDETWGERIYRFGYPVLKLFCAMCSFLIRSGGLSLLALCCCRCRRVSTHDTLRAFPTIREPFSSSNPPPLSLLVGEYRHQHGLSAADLPKTYSSLACLALPCVQNYARADDKIALHNHEDAGYTLAHNAYSHM